MLKAYTDGSFKIKDEKGYIGWAYVILNNEDEIIHQDSGLITDYGVHHRNITGECRAIIEVVKYCKNNGINEIEVCHDYIGCAHWVNGSWKARNEMTIGYKSYVQSSGIDVKFTHIKGHSGNKFNELVDEMAKSHVL